MMVTFLFVPAQEDKKVAKALESGAGAVILDLEDSVPPDQKFRARAHAAKVVSTLSSSSTREIWVRLNSDDQLKLDLEAIDWGRATGAFLSKAETSQQVAQLTQAGVRRAVLLIESVLGLYSLSSLVSDAPIVERLAFGAQDLSLDLGLSATLDPDQSELMWQVRGTLVLESRRLGLRAPIDGVWVDLQDEVGLRDISVRAKRLGFGGKLVIHPKQLSIVQSVFTPDPAEIVRARSIVKAGREAQLLERGAVQFEGKMIDRAVIERARVFLACNGEE